MAEVVVTINGRAFPLTVADGEEPRIRRLASYVDGKVGEFVKTHGQIGEARLILLAALVIADELDDTSNAFQRERVRPTGEAAEATAPSIRSIAERIDSIAARLETS